MRSVTIKKATVLERLNTSRDLHQAEYLRARENWRQQLYGALQETLEALNPQQSDRLDHKPVDLYKIASDHAEPTNHLPDFDRIIGMLKLHEGDTVEVTEEEFEAFVLGNFGWRAKWVASNSKYLG